MASRLTLYESSSDEDEETEPEPPRSEEIPLGKKRPRSETKVATAGAQLQSTSDRPAKSAKVVELVEGEEQAPVRETSARSQKQQIGDHHSGGKQVESKIPVPYQRSVATISTAAQLVTASQPFAPGRYVGSTSSQPAQYPQPQGYGQSQTSIDAVQRTVGRDAEAAHAAAASLGIPPAVAAGLDPKALRDMMKASGGGRRKGRLRADLTQHHGGGSASVATLVSGVKVHSLRARDVHGSWSAEDVAAVGSAPAPQRTVLSTAWDASSGKMTTIEGAGVGVGQRKRQNQLTVMASRAMQLETERIGPTAEENARAAKKASKKKYGF